MADVQLYRIVNGPSGFQIVADRVVDSSTFPAGDCQGNTPHLLCPTNAVRNGMAALVLTSFFGGSKTAAALAGAAAWYASSGLWWV